MFCTPMLWRMHSSRNPLSYSGLHSQTSYNGTCVFDSWNSDTGLVANCSVMKVEEEFFAF